MKRLVGRRARAIAGIAALLAIAVPTAGCVQRTPPSRATAAARAACGQHADAVYRMRNPDVIYREDTYATSTRDAPFAGAGLSSIPTAGLSGRYERDVMVDDCLNGGGGTVGAAPDAPMPEETRVQRPSAPAPPHP